MRKNKKKNQKTIFCRRIIALFLVMLMPLLIMTDIRTYANSDVKDDAQNTTKEATSQQSDTKENTENNLETSTPAQSAADQESVKQVESKPQLKGNAVLDPETQAALQKTLRSNYMPIDIVVNNQFLLTNVDPFVFKANTYVPIRSMVNLIEGATIYWNGEYKRVDITLPLKNGQKTLSFFTNSNDYIVNGVKKKMQLPTIQVNGAMMISLNSIASLMELTVNSDLIYFFATIQVPNATINQNALTSRYYTPSEVIQFSRLIYKEAGAAGYDAMHGVASVVLNHVRHPYYPNTVNNVIFARAPSGAPHYVPAHKPNFSSVIPNYSSVLAAKRVLRGENSVANCIYFNTRPFKNKKIYKVVSGIYFCY